MRNPPSNRVLDRVHHEMVRFRSRRLGELAVSREYITAEQLDRCLKEQKDRRLGEMLVDKGWLTGSQLQSLLEEKDNRDAGVFAAADPSVPREVEEAETRLGKYRLVEVISQGGMGRIWKAWDEELRRWVAIKMLKEEVLSDQTRVRFLREAQVAAGLRHPHLVTIHDFGEKDGKPYIVMERVEGKVLDPSREIVAILIKVARALHVAHRKGIVHRDLKPANILVDAGGEPRVVDFGLVHVDRIDREMTRPGLIIGTPDYMAPEQVSGRSGEIGPWTDVHALGLILYESMAGSSPYAAGTVTRTIEKMINHEPPPPEGPKDLAVICLRAIEKNPDRRYGTAADLADDLQRYLDGEPIQARPPSIWYRFVRKVSKHRNAVVVSLLLLLMVGGAAVVFAAGWIGESRELQKQQRQEEALRRAEPHLQEGRDLLSRLNLSLVANPPDDGAVVSLAAKVREKFEAALAESPGHPGALLGIGRVHLLLLETDRAMEYFDLAIRAGEPIEPALVERALLKTSRYTMIRLGRPGETLESAALLREIESDLTRVREGSPDKVDLQLAEGLRLFAQGNYDSAAVELEQYAQDRVSDHRGWYWACVAWERHGDMERAYEAVDKALKFRPWVSSYLVQRGILRLGREESDAARKDFEEAIRRRPDNGYAHNNLAVVLMERRDLEAARRHLLRAVEIDPTHGMAWMNLGKAQLLTGRVDEALDSYHRTLKLMSWHHDAWYNRGTCWMAMRKWARAEADFSRALEIRSDYGAALVNRGVVRARQGKGDEALSDFSEAIRQSPQDFNAFNNRAHHLKVLGRWKEALRDYNRAIELNPENMAAFNGRGGVWMKMEDHARAMADYNEAVRLKPDRVEPYANRAQLHAALGNREASIRDLEKALEVAPTDWQGRSSLEKVLRRLRGE